MFLLNNLLYLNFFCLGIEVNFMDDVGQTLLNWASAFGTQEMVEFLCERGADVNKGQRSSSLHYAACFGRPGVAKVFILKYCIIILNFMLGEIHTIKKYLICRIIFCF